MNSSGEIFKSVRNLAKPLLAHKIPLSISRRFLNIDKDGLDQIRASLLNNYYSQEDKWFDAAYLSSAEGKSDLEKHLHLRLVKFRDTIIPWLNDTRSLNGSKILEIGCGTGCSTVALAEQGAIVTAVDILEPSLVVAKDRCDVYGLSADFHCANATEVHKIFKGHHFDYILFFANLEHMTHDERMIAMKNTWDMLSPGSLWCVIETPNRLWYEDSHTSQLPFYHWLPDDLAFAYSRFSPRKGFSDLYRDFTADSKLDFLRRGRGVSYHEFELTMKRAEELDIISSLPLFLRDHNLLRKVLGPLRADSRFESFLVRSGPKIHRGFYQRNLDLIIRKG